MIHTIYGTTLYLPVSEERRQEVVKDTENLKVDADNLMQTVETSDRNGGKSAYSLISPNNFDKGIPVYKDDLGRFFLAHTSEVTANRKLQCDDRYKYKYYKVYLELPVGYTPIKKQVSLTVQSTFERNLSKVIYNYNLTAGMAEGGALGDERVLYVTERPTFNDVIKPKS